MLIVTLQWQVKEGSESDQIVIYSIYSDASLLAWEITAPASGFLKWEPTPSEFFFSHFADVIYPTEQTTQGKLCYVASL